MWLDRHSRCAVCSHICLRTSSRPQLRAVGEPVYHRDSVRERLCLQQLKRSQLRFVERRNMQNSSRSFSCGTAVKQECSAAAQRLCSVGTLNCPAGCVKRNECDSASPDCDGARSLAAIERRPRQRKRLDRHQLPGLHNTCVTPKVITNCIPRRLWRQAR